MKIDLQNCEICSTKHELITRNNNAISGKHENTKNQEYTHFLIECEIIDKGHRESDDVTLM